MLVRSKGIGGKGRKRGGHSSSELTSGSCAKKGKKDEQNTYNNAMSF